MGEGEGDVFMETLIPTQFEITPPPIVIVNWGTAQRTRSGAEW